MTAKLRRRFVYLKVAILSVKYIKEIEKPQQFLEFGAGYYVHCDHVVYKKTAVCIFLF
jgi:hypothetical protein